MANLRVTYDEEANAAYIYLTDPRVNAGVANMYACDPVEAGGMINLDLDSDGRLVGIEVLAASSKLPQYLLDMAERADIQRA
ncbi:DUF2283 domain-containing protein [Micromonospora lupini]|uniref:DUF2283 domain-containing protein n=1 Tax=Micromonospora lupini TaxID=285679 RepID=UPI0033EE421B